MDNPFTVHKNIILTLHTDIHHAYIYIHHTDKHNIYHTYKNHTHTPHALVERMNILCIIWMHHLSIKKPMAFRKG